MKPFDSIKQWLAKANKKQEEPITGIDLEVLWQRLQRADDGHAYGATDYLRDRKETDADELSAELDENDVDTRIQHNSTLPRKMPVFTGNKPRPLMLVEKHHSAIASCAETALTSPSGKYLFFVFFASDQYHYQHPSRYTAQRTDLVKNGPRDVLHFSEVRGSSPDAA